MASIKIIQSYYNESQKSELSVHAEHFFNKWFTEIFENQTILDLLNEGSHKNVDYWGLASWRIKDKVAFDVDELKRIINENPGYDVYNYGLWEGPITMFGPKHRRRRWIERLYESGLLPENKYMMWHICLGNFWVASKEVCEEYKKFLTRLHEFCREDREMRHYLSKEPRLYRDKYYPEHGFFYEYFFGLFLWHNKHLKIMDIPNKNKYTSGPLRLEKVHELPLNQRKQIMKELPFEAINQIRIAERLAKKKR